MPATSTATNLSQRLEALRADRGESVRLTEVAGVVECLMQTLEGDLSALEIRTHRELQELVGYIQRAKREILAIQPTEIPEHHIPVATDELDAVIQATEEATDKILDAAEQLNAMAAAGKGKQSEKLEAIATQIYEASNFQDITGQRITKVVKTLRHIESKVVALVRAFGGDIGEIAIESPPPPPENDASLLNGPQMPDKANSQADIDALLASFD